MELSTESSNVSSPVVPVVRRQIFPFEENDVLNDDVVDEDDDESMAVFVDSPHPHHHTPSSPWHQSDSSIMVPRGAGGGRVGICRICHQFEDEEEGEGLLSPCKCTAHVHRSCLENWLTISNRDRCEVCLHPFKIDRVYGSIFKYLRLGMSQKKRRFLFVDLTWLIFSSYIIGHLILSSVDASACDWYKPGCILPIGSLIMNGMAVAAYTSWLFCGVSYYRTHWIVWRRKNSRVRLLDQSSVTVSGHHRSHDDNDQLSSQDHPIEVTSDTRPLFRDENN